MVQILPPVVPDPPVFDIDSGYCASVKPWPHTRFLDDYEYYDQLGRDPFQQFRVWKISDPAERVEMVQRVLEKFPKQKHRRQMLFDASLRGDEPVVRCIVGTGLKVHPDMPRDQAEAEEPGDDEAEGSLPDKDDPTTIPLHVAATHGHLGCVKIFIESGVEVDARDDIGRTPLIAAAHGCYPEIMRYLLDAGADPTARTYADEPLTDELIGWLAGAGALEMAATHNNVKALNLLLEAIEKKASNRNDDSNPMVTPLAIKAAAYGGIEAFNLLLSKANYPTEDKDGKPKSELLTETQRATLVDATPLVLEFGSLETITQLLSYQYPVSANGTITFSVPSALHKPVIWGAYEAMKNQPAKFEFLHGLGVTEHASMSLDPIPDGQRMNYQFLLERAVEAGSVDCVRLLVEKYGARPERSRFPPRLQPLYIAAAHDRTEMVRYLLENYELDGHLGSGRYAAGPTALWIAVQLKSLGSIALLLRHGGPLDYIDEDILNENVDADEPTAFLRATFDERERPVVRFEIWSPEEAHFAATRGDFQDRNPSYVRVRLGPEDRDWVRGLQYRRADDGLRDQGEWPRALDKSQEAEMMPEMGEDDVRRKLTDYPTVLSREEELKCDDDLLPGWRPCMVPVREGEGD